VDTPGSSGQLLKGLSQSEYLKISELLDAALEMAPEIRSSWLEELARSDFKSASLLREMFSSQEAPGAERFLETRDLLRHHVERLAPADEGLTGKLFGPYRVLSPLGYGGMGRVWLAERVDGLFTRQVALKLVHPALKSRVMTERFAREREILASLNHPNIARLLDAGFAEDGQPYLALDYVAGTPITTYCDDRRLPVRERLELFRQVLSAVENAHAYLVIHRDLKPANILVTGDGTVKLLDFGIAKLLTQGEAKETELTQLGGRAWTPDYAAPEQIDGGAITTSADVYSLGVMLYELLTGERPYKLKRDSRGALEEAILAADPVAPSRAALSETAAGQRATTPKKLSSTLRGELDTIALKALKKSPSERYATVNAFAEDIERFLRGDVVLAQPDRVAYRVSKFMRRHWAGIAATSVLVLVLAGGLVATTYEARIASAQRDAAREAQLRLLTQAASQYLKASDLPRAQGVILEVLRNPKFAQARNAAAISVFQEIRAADAELAVLSGHGDQVRSAAYSPDGTRIVTASIDKTARVWDARTGVQLAVISGHHERVRTAAFSPDGRRIVTSSWDKTARIWDANTGAQLAVLTGHEGFVVGAAYSPDGTRIITASYDKTARIWDAATGASLRVLSGHGDVVRSAAFSPDGNRIVTASWDKTARIWDAGTGRQLSVLAGHDGFVVSAAYSPDGERVVTTSVDRTARIWDARTGAQLTVLSGHASDVNSAAYSPDGANVVTASTDKTMRIWDAHSGIPLATFANSDREVGSAAWSPDGTRIVTASYDGTARIWDARLGKQLATLPRQEQTVGSAVYSPDGQRILTAGFDKTARVWDADLRRQFTLLAGHEGFVATAAYSPDGTRIVTGSNDKTARIWDARSGHELAVLVGHDGYLNTVVYSPDGSHIVTVSWDKTARIWDARTAAQVAVLSGHGGAVISAAYSPDGAHIVTASYDRTARIWDARSAKETAVLVGHEGYLMDGKYSADGTRIVTASYDNTARIWDARSGVQVAELSGHAAAVTTVAFSPDGTRIVTGSQDNTARIWDARQGTQLAVLLGHTAQLNTVAYSPDGTRIVTSSEDRTARVWDANVPASLDEQIDWEAAAQTEALSQIDRTRLGLAAVAGRAPMAAATSCDEAAAAFYDPDRLARGASQSDITADIADSACAMQGGQPEHSARTAYLWGRALLAKHDAAGARREFELAVAKGYRAARIDLGDLLLDGSTGPSDLRGAAAAYARAWQDGVPIAAFKLGQLYENGVAGAAASIDEEKAWVWYRRGEEAGEPNAFARFAEREERAALAERDPARADARLLQSFRLYAAAAGRAEDEDWPDAAWRHWRYRRATLARFLAGEGMMSRVAAEYIAARDQLAARDQPK
jgi:WD40 repeat protein/serine/threonine protein kinase